MECSPFIISGDLNGHGNQIQILRSSHNSKSNLVLPLVGTSQNPRGIDSGTQMKNYVAADNDFRQMLSISGVGLSVNNQHFPLGTGPLFTFHNDDTLDSALEVETNLLGSVLANVSSSSDFSPGKQLFGSEMYQCVVGSSVSHSTNHDSGTGMMSPNLGGNLMCLNTSFSTCIREQNSQQDFLNKNYTQGSRLNNITSDITSVTFTLCTFNKMTIDTEHFGGGAIFLYMTYSFLTIRTCFFHNCSCTGREDDGGALYFMSHESLQLPLTICDSSFTDCDAEDCGGSVLAYLSSPTTIDGCFFDVSTAKYDGAMFLTSFIITISNCAFVDCSAYYRAGAVSIDAVSTLFLSFLQFRECSATAYPRASDLYFFSITSYAVTADMFECCDSTSDPQNVYFAPNDKWDSTLVPRITSTPTIKSVDVSHDGDAATVTVETEEAIKGTMGVLLNGSNVPRLVHVVFGTPSEESRFGTAVVSSGAKGVLPNTKYSHHKSSFAAYLFPPWTVHAAHATLKDWNTTEIILKGTCIEEGSYWMLVEKEGEKWNVTLTRSDSTTLTGTSPLHPSTAEGRLEWATEYKVTKVMWLLPDGMNEEEAILSNTITFTTPDEPARIEACTNHLLNEDRTKMKLFLEGRAFVSRTGKVNLANGRRSWDSLSDVDVLDNTHCTAEFAVGEEETSDQLKYGETYTLKGSWTESNGFHVEDGIKVVVPLTPTITRMDIVFIYGRQRSCLIRLTGRDLKKGTTYEVTLNTSITLKVTFTTSTEGKSNEVSIGESEIIQYSSTYTMTSLEPTNDDDGSIDFDLSLSFTTGDKIVDLIVSEGGSNRTDECGTYSTPCGSIAIGWTTGAEGAILHILKSARFEDQIWVGQKTLVMRSLLEGKSRVVVDDDLPLEGKEEGVVAVAGGSVHMMELTLCLRRPSLLAETKVGFVVSGFGECVFDEVRVVESWEGEGVGMGMVSMSGGSLKLTKIEMKSIWIESEMSLVKCNSNATEMTLKMEDCLFIEVETRDAELVAFSSTLTSSRFEMEGCTFISTNRNETKLKGERMGLILVSTSQERTEIRKCVFSDCGTLRSGSGGRKTGGVLNVEVRSESRLERKEVHVVDTVVMDSSPFRESDGEKMSGGVVVRSEGKGQVVVDVGGSWFEETRISKQDLERDPIGIPTISPKRKIVHSLLSDMPAGLFVSGGGCVPVIVRRGSTFSGCSLRVEKKQPDTTAKHTRMNSNLFSRIVDPSFTRTP
ncbi:hypothetical protein BLNAU_23722 [Blattamonas nauphoetae]|uniref:Right handed beta helix domain-containing protein n=1 Tax=Blattamonas nauphoetae TaxID=2049346 RepID=A0ABQ9WTK7_9EUKA|nr:hypothetical protein BLNAU_23722 [Blattamonas nauphoetae]